MSASESNNILDPGSIQTKPLQQDVIISGVKTVSSHGMNLALSLLASKFSAMVSA
jgi:hypothetical protein